LILPHWLLVAAVLLALVVAWLRFWRLCERANSADWGSRWLNRLDGLNRLFCRRFHRLRSDVIPLPTHGCAILVANHISGLDPLLLLAATQRPLRFMIAREQYERFGLMWLFRAIGCIPVDRETRPEFAMRAGLRALRDGEVVAIFPQGGIHANPDKNKTLKGGAVRLAQMTGSHVYPVFVEGVKGRGETLVAVLRRSHARVWAYRPFACVEHEREASLQVLGQLLNVNHPVKEHLLPSEHNPAKSASS